MRLTLMALAALAVLCQAGVGAAATCSDSAQCPTYFECIEGACREAGIACVPACPAHLSCAPTTTTAQPSGEPAPSGFLCSWHTTTCSPASPCPVNFECVLCEPPERNFSCSEDQCLPSRLPCQSHDDCPEAFHCYDFTAEQVPDYWPPGAGRACKPLLGALYGPRALSGGTLLDRDGGMPAQGAADPGATSSASARDARESSGCGCRVLPSQPLKVWLALGPLALLALRRRAGVKAPSVS